MQAGAYLILIQYFLLLSLQLLTIHIYAVAIGLDVRGIACK